MKTSYTSVKPIIAVKTIKEHDVGGDLGYRFDSGCNPTGVTKIHIVCGHFKYDKKEYKWAVLRVFLEFADSSKNPSYHVYQISRGILSTFQVNPGDKITKIVVWADELSAHALQIHTKYGIISELYGCPNQESKPHEFYGGSAFEGRDDIELVGVHGKCGELLDRLGFTFAAVVP